MSVAETYEPEPESVKLWIRDWGEMPDRAQVRFCTPDGRLGVEIGQRRGGASEQDIEGPWPKGSELLGWYWLGDPESDAAYGYPGEGLGT